MITIRKAHLDDAALLSEMGYSSYTHHFAHLWHEHKALQAFLSQEYSLSVLQQSLQSKTSSWFIAQTHNPVGFAKVSWHCSVGEGEPAGTLLHKLYLLPGETGKGYGETLFAEMVSMAQRRGETFFWLEVLDANPQAYRFYIRQGLVHIKDTIFSTATQPNTLHILGKHF
ncbi:TPA: GNAT family N-acetyltransferase [Salmonella enterica]|uniref:GNAT family N-acetyltransferase n=2 Tax=Salmonella enterica TaxID=28901 RepID=A0A403T6L1_SALER|nr:GNAT family N-acetyltransferase [Salmonella enterica subsp. enterica serovar Java]EAU6348423.1 GNAT family N-acetyltransferase [Salmonella enterica]EBX7469834.1 GNAT family N-acetyltransferase [Salmonella enterica subsp. enterica serovar Bareilly]ECI8027243.1 GNAT family N-acetyltransferase [Salmonella enterica subsp. enterica serovar Ramatgan]ECJ2363921.1 GNAT family N-acetyltransferase [Salmonella enterica subsp. diarizonae]EDL3493581.1 N-acetyltransferase [Salmonella enterica subsp. ente